MKTSKHILKLNTLFGKTKDEINKMISEGHINSIDLSLDELERAYHNLLREVERCDLVKGDKE